MNLVYREHYDQLMGSGLYEDLTRDRLLIPHEELEDAAWDPSRAYKVIRPEPIEFISYPYEWCFSQLQDAALATLEIQRHAIARGMTLKDCSAYNVQFQHGPADLHRHALFRGVSRGEPLGRLSPVLRALPRTAGADEPEGSPAEPVRSTNIDGIPLDLAARLLPIRSWFRWGLMIHLHLHATLQSTHSGRPSPPPGASTGMSRNAVLGLIDSLESAVCRLRWRPSGRRLGLLRSGPSLYPGGIRAQGAAGPRVPRSDRGRRRVGPRRQHGGLQPDRRGDGPFDGRLRL